MPGVVAIVQARTSSTRLPGKVLAEVGRHALIDRVLQQVRASSTLDEVVVATSTHPSDDALADHLRSRGVPVYRGDLEDVLARFADVARTWEADAIVRLTGDCPLHSPDTIDEVVTAFLRAEVDYASNTSPYSRPDGQDVEVFTRALLERAVAEATDAVDREHVTPFMKRAAGARRMNVTHRAGPDGGRLRWSVDDASDLEYARAVWARLDELGEGPHRYDTIFRIAADVPVNGRPTLVNEGYYRSLFAAADGLEAPPLTLERSEAWLARSEKVIPAGAQTYSKSWQQHIRGVSPLFLDRGEGAWVWDVDGNRYVDLIQGLLPNILGYAHPAVNQAVIERVGKGHSFSLAHPLEVELAERLTRLFPCAEMVRFGKNGSDATAGAVRAARAFTGRSRIACCGYHGWQDWFIGTTTRSGGVPAEVSGLTHPFPYNDPGALAALLESHPHQFAAVIMEPFNFVWPEEGYLDEVKRIAHRHGALLIFDEICTGIHLGPGGAQALFRVTPDLATFGKALGNGYAISCIAGRKDVMRVFDDVFFSFTFAGDASAMAAAMAVLDHLEGSDAYAVLAHAGQKLRDGALALAQMAGLGDRFQVRGHPNWTLLRFLSESQDEDPILKTLWQQEVVRRGVLVLATHNLSTALDDAAIEHVLRAYAAAFKYIGRLLENGTDLSLALDGPVPQPAFRARG